MEKAKARSAKRVSTAKTKIVQPKVAVVKKAVSKKNKISPEEFLQQVQMKAYLLYEQRGYSSGNDMADWLEAERIVKDELGWA